jgi:hypothetical protein
MSDRVLAVLTFLALILSILAIGLVIGHIDGLVG